MAFQKKKHNPPNVDKILVKNSPFEVHGHGCVLSIVLSLAMMERLNKAIENERSLGHAGIKKEGPNGLMAGFLLMGLQHNEANFQRRKEVLDCKLAGKPIPPKPLKHKSPSMLKGQMAYFGGLVEHLQGLMKSMEAGDAEPLKKWAEFLISQNNEASERCRLQLERSEKP